MLCKRITGRLSVFQFIEQFVRRQIIAGIQCEAPEIEAETDLSGPLQVAVLIQQRVYFLQITPYAETESRTQKQMHLEVLLVNEIVTEQNRYIDKMLSEFSILLNLAHKRAGIIDFGAFERIAGLRLEIKLVTDTHKQTRVSASGKTGEILVVGAITSHFHTNGKLRIRLKHRESSDHCDKTKKTPEKIVLYHIFFTLDI